jgi:hypothetical protein
VYQSADQDFLWVPQQALAVVQNVGAGSTLVLECDPTIWDYWRIDWCSLVMTYVFSDGNASFEGCMVDTDDNYFPFIAVAAEVNADIVPEFYQNKYYANTEALFYLGANQSIYIRGESGVGSSSSGSLFVAWSAARAPAG